jgi:ligand-binding sensor domain-containing protein/two-component sensor histidine kinase
MRVYVIAVLFWLAAAVQAAPADYSPSLSRFRRIGTEQGLSQASVRALVQDRAGFIWIGTQDGLNRFDGSEFRLYRRQEGQADSLPGDLVQALAIDPQGVLWVGTSGGLARYREDLDRFEPVPIQGESGAQAEVRRLHVDRKGRLWIASYGGLSRYDPGTGKRRAWRFAPSNAPPDTRFETLESDREGRLWLGSLAGLTRLDPDSGRLDFPSAGVPLASPLASARIDALVTDARGVMWIGAVGQGLFRHDPASGDWRVFRHREDEPDSLDSDAIRSLLLDDDGDLWVGTREGLNLMQEPDAAEPRFLRFRHYRQDPRSLGSGRVMSLLQARDGSLLVGTNTGGLNILNPRGNRFTSFTPDSQATAALRDPVIYSLLADGEHALWLGGRKGLYRFEPDSGQLQVFPATADLGISALMLDGRDLWLGVLKGVVIVDTDTGRTRVPALPPRLAGGQITRLWMEGDRLVAGTYDRGVFVLRRSDLSLLAHYPITSWVSHVQRFDERTLLVLGSDGLHWLSSDGTLEKHAHRASSELDAALPSGGITHFLRAADGSLWLATAGSGLLRMHLSDPGNPATARFEVVREVLAQGIKLVQALAEDGQGRLWLSTSNGIVRFDPASGDLAMYGAADGAFDSDYQSAAIARLGDGRLVFAATGGITVFDPDRIGDNPAAAAPLLTELRLWNRRVEPVRGQATAPLSDALHRTQRIAIPAAAAGMVGLRFAALELLAPERLRYRYRLEGFDPGWIDAQPGERGATYTNLPPGSYRFQVKAGEPGRLERATTTSLRIDILPPWWQTLWARSLSVLAVLGLLYAGYRWRIRSIVSQRQRLQRKVDQRTAELSQAMQRAEQALTQLRETQHGLVEAEKMASLGSLVAGVAHEINTPLGVAVTAASLFGDRTAALQKQFEAGKLSANELADFLRTAREASAMVDRNLERTAQLVSSFKQVSVDHFSDERRRFVLGDWLRSMLHSLAPQWKRRPITFELDVEEGLGLDSYPGAISKVVSNLIQNALVHAFDEDEAGTLRLEARGLGDDLVELVVADSGHGIPDEVLPHVFEPFYTTRRGRGGTGLGLHAVYNLVTGVLGGQIRVQSSPQGTRMVVTFPRTAK